MNLRRSLSVFMPIFALGIKQKYIMANIWQELKNKNHKRYLGGLDIFKYIGPGLLVTVGFIDPGNWA